MSALSIREALTRALHRHTCGVDYDEWNQPCVWAGEDWDPENGPATCAYVDEIGVEEAVLAWVATLAEPFGDVAGAVAEAIEGQAAFLPVAGPPIPVQRCYAEGIAQAALRALTAVLTQRGAK